MNLRGFRLVGYSLGLLCFSWTAISSRAAAPTPASPVKFPDNQGLRQVRSLMLPKLSPDGNSVLVQVADSTADGGKSHLWLVDIGHKAHRQLTFSPAGPVGSPTASKPGLGEFAGSWMPDGSAVLFLSHRGEHTQLYRLPMDGGEASPYDLKIIPPVDESKRPDAVPPVKKSVAQDATTTPEKPVEIDVSRYWIAPGGKTIALLARDPQTSGEKKQKDAKADAIWVDHDPHGTRLYLLDAASDKLTAAAVPPNVDFVAWRSSGDRLLALTEAPNNAGDLGPARSAWVVDLKTLEHPVKLDKIPATISTAAWTSDGQALVYTAQARQDAPPGYSDLYAYRLATQTVEDLSANLQGSLSAQRLIASGKGKVLVGMEQGVRVTAALVNAGASPPQTGSNRIVQPLSFDFPVVSAWNTNARRTGWVYLASSSTQPPILCYQAKLSDQGTNTCEALPIPEIVPHAWKEAPSKIVHWQSDHEQIEGLLYLPPQPAQGKVPLIVDVHGGPLGAFHDGYAPWVQFLVAQGWAVLRPNPRGSSAYGASFAAANKNDLGGGDYRDIMRGVDAMLQKYPLDGSRMALIGYSYGGEMAAFVEGKTDRFRAIVSGAPVIDQYSEYGTEDSSWYDRWYFGKPWQQPADAWKQSPLAGVAHAKTPFLLLQGQGDTTDPLGQSVEMYRALRQQGVPVELIEYPRDNHGPLAIGMFGLPSSEAWHGYDARQRVVEFIRKNFAESGK